MFGGSGERDGGLKGGHWEGDWGRGRGGGGAFEGSVVRVFGGSGERGRKAGGSGLGIWGIGLT